MTIANVIEIVETLRIAFETRHYNKFVDLFSDDGTYELPFALPDSPQRFTGIAAIQARFDAITKNPTTKLVNVQNVSANIMQTTDPEVVVVELTVHGTTSANDEEFTIASSIAVIRISNGKVTQYRDYPNTLGIAKVAGVLSQLADSLK